MHIIEKSKFKKYKSARGIYGIVNTIKKSPYWEHGQVYIGQADFDYKDEGVGRRLRGHCSNLRNNKHPNKHLQSSWNKYGEENFIFVLIEEVPEEISLLNRENFWMMELHSNEEDTGFNKRMVAESNLGSIFKPLDENIVLEWIKQYKEENGKYPTDQSGICMYSENDDTWKAIDAALNTGSRGIKKYGSIGNFTAQKLGIINNTNKPDLYPDKLRFWISSFYDKYNKYPNQDTGIIEFAKSDGYEESITWKAVHQCLYGNLRGLNLDTTLAKFIAKEFNVVNQSIKPNYTLEIIASWISKFKTKYGKFPGLIDGQIEFAAEDGYGNVTWGGLDKAMSEGYCGLDGDISLAQFIEERFNYVKRGSSPKQSNELILKWIELYYDEHKIYPTKSSGTCTYAAIDGHYLVQWSTIELNLRKNRNGVNYGKGGISEFIIDFARFPPFTFEESKMESQKMGIKTRRDYVKRRKENSRFPGDPEKAYKNKWIDWYEFLGKEEPKPAIKASLSSNTKIIL